MEYCMIARALKPSLQRELPMLKSSLSSPSTMTTSQQSFFDDMYFNNSNVINPVVEDFSVDCFFDFSNGDFKEQHNSSNMIGVVNPEEEEEDDDYEEDEEEEEEEEKDSLSVSSQERTVDDDNNSNSCCGFSDSLFTSELPVPVDELAELEWVSQFVDDSSSSELSLLYPLKSDDFNNNIHAKNRFQPEQLPKIKPSSCIFPFKVPAKPRSKRTRTTSRTWSVEFLHANSSSSLSSYSSSSSSSPVSSSASTPCLIPVQTIDSVTNLIEPPMKKPKKKPASQTGELVTGWNQFQRRCSHCQVQKTPQWRTGPLGAKTLCNACGVRYKSGRLFPEYRPACSPTFSSNVHSNSHRKVLEMRKRKETDRTDQSGLSYMVPIF